MATQFLRSGQTSEGGESLSGRFPYVELRSRDVNRAIHAVALFFGRSALLRPFKGCELNSYPLGFEPKPNPRAAMAHEVPDVPPDAGKRKHGTRPVRVCAQWGIEGP